MGKTGRRATAPVLPLFTGVRGRAILRTSGVGGSKKFAPSWSRWHHAYGGKVGPSGSKSGSERRSPVCNLLVFCQLSRYCP